MHRYDRQIVDRWIHRQKKRKIARQIYRKVDRQIDNKEKDRYNICRLIKGSLKIDRMKGIQIHRQIYVDK